MKLQKNSSSEPELKKHVYAIHCANSLTLVERKLFNALLYNAYHDLPHQSQFEIPTKELCNKIGYISNDTSKIKNALIALMSTVIEWNILDNNDDVEKSRKWQASSILASAKIENGMCSYEYSSVMRAQLYHPDIYGKLKLDTLSKFTSGYGLALYENCVRFQNLEFTPWFPMATFRKLMGVSEEQYSDIRNFKKRVLDIAINEVNKNSTLNVTVEYKKEGRKIEAIRFKLAYAIEKDTLIDFFNDDLVKELTEIFFFSQEQINRLFEQYEKGYISQKIKIILESESFVKGTIKDMG
ncbi:MAG: replication initiation protein, partial [Legionellales bacterium]|nr:replication initiation protein [Legionellales bacterium]